MELDMRAKERRLRELPKARKSRTLSVEPNRPKDRRLIELPIIAKSSTEAEEPKRAI
jgi:hypothetical protein